VKNDNISIFPTTQRPKKGGSKCVELILIRLRLTLSTFTLSFLWVVVWV